MMDIVEPIRNKKEIEQVKLILKKQRKRDYLLFLIGINVGLRISDILKLKVDDVKDKDYIVLKEQKTNKRKKIPIVSSFKFDLQDYIKDKNPKEWLFPSRVGNNPISRIQAYRIIKQACEKVGIKSNIGTHTLRKTFGYHFYKETKDIALLQYIFNHSSQSITMKYIGINQDIVDSRLKMFAL